MLARGPESAAVPRRHISDSGKSGKERAVVSVDDALASVDMKTSAQIIGELRKERSRRTVIIVSQRLAAVMPSAWRMRT